MVSKNNRNNNSRRNRSSDEMVYGIEAGLLTSGHRFAWSENHTTIFEIFVKQGKSANKFNLARLLADLNLDGFENVLNETGESAYSIILAKVMRKISNTRKALRLRDLEDHQLRYPAQSARPARPVSPATGVNLTPITPRRSGHPTATLRPASESFYQRASSGAETPPAYHFEAPEDRYAGPGSSFFTLRLPEQTTANLPNAQRMQPQDTLLAEKLAAQRDYIYNWASDMMDDHNTKMIFNVIGRQEGQKLVGLLSLLQTRISDMDFLL